MLRLVLLLVALAIGGSAAWLAVAMRYEPVAVSTPAEPAPQVPLQEVLVASSDIGRGQPLSTENMRWQAWPQNALNGAYIHRSARPDAIEALSGSLLRSDMIAGEPVREEKLLRSNAGFLAAMLPAGKRAIAVRISAETTAGGLILPQDRVDVVHTTSRNAAEGEGEQISRTILRNIPVLAIDQSIADKSGGEKSKDEKEKEKPAAVGKTATLEVDSQQAEVLANAEATGTLSLALRSVADNGEPTTVSLPEDGRKQSTRKTETAANEKPASEPVTILRGSQTTAAKTL